jgi:hypothetical protein
MHLEAPPSHDGPEHERTAGGILGERADSRTA